MESPDSPVTGTTKEEKDTTSHLSDDSYDMFDGSTTSGDELVSVTTDPVGDRSPGRAGTGDVELKLDLESVEADALPTLGSQTISGVDNDHNRVVVNDVDLNVVDASVNVQAEDESKFDHNEALTLEQLGSCLRILTYALSAIMESTGGVMGMAEASTITLQVEPLRRDISAIWYCVSILLSNSDRLPVESWMQSGATQQRIAYESIRAFSDARTKQLFGIALSPLVGTQAARETELDDLVQPDPPAKKARSESPVFGSSDPGKAPPAPDHPPPKGPAPVKDDDEFADTEEATAAFDLVSMSSPKPGKQDHFDSIEGNALSVTVLMPDGNEVIWKVDEDATFGQLVDDMAQFIPALSIKPAMFASLPDGEHTAKRSVHPNASMKEAFGDSDALVYLEHQTRGGTGDAMLNPGTHGASNPAADVAASVGDAEALAAVELLNASAAAITSGKSAPAEASGGAAAAVSGAEANVKKAFENIYEYDRKIWAIPERGNGNNAFGQSVQRKAVTLAQANGDQMNYNAGIGANVDFFPRFQISEFAGAIGSFDTFDMYLGPPGVPNESVWPQVLHNVESREPTPAQGRKLLRPSFMADAEATAPVGDFGPLAAMTRGDRVQLNGQTNFSFLMMLKDMSKDTTFSFAKQTFVMLRGMTRGCVQNTGSIPGCTGAFAQPEWVADPGEEHGIQAQWFNPQDFNSPCPAIFPFSNRPETATSPSGTISASALLLPTLVADGAPGAMVPQINAGVITMGDLLWIDSQGLQIPVDVLTETPGPGIYGGPSTFPNGGPNGPANMNTQAIRLESGRPVQAAPGDGLPGPPPARPPLSRTTIGKYYHLIPITSAMAERPELMCEWTLLWAENPEMRGFRGSCRTATDFNLFVAGGPGLPPHAGQDGFIPKSEMCKYGGFGNGAVIIYVLTDVDDQSRRAGQTSGGVYSRRVEIGLTNPAAAVQGVPVPGANGGAYQKVTLNTPDGVQMHEGWGENYAAGLGNDVEFPDPAAPAGGWPAVAVPGNVFRGRPIGGAIMGFVCQKSDADRRSLSRKCFECAVEMNFIGDDDLKDAILMQAIASTIIAPQPHKVGDTMQGIGKEVVQDAGGAGTMNDVLKNHGYVNMMLGLSAELRQYQYVDATGARLNSSNPMIQPRRDGGAFGVGFAGTYPTAGGVIQPGQNGHFPDHRTNTIGESPSILATLVMAGKIALPETGEFVTSFLSLGAGQQAALVTQAKISLLTGLQLISEDMQVGEQGIFNVERGVNKLQRQAALQSLSSTIWNLAKAKNPRSTVTGTLAFNFAAESRMNSDSNYLNLCGFAASNLGIGMDAAWPAYGPANRLAENQTASAVPRDLIAPAAQQPLTGRMIQYLSDVDLVAAGYERDLPTGARQKIDSRNDPFPQEPVGDRLVLAGNRPGYVGNGPGLGAIGLTFDQLVDVHPSARAEVLEQFRQLLYCNTQTTAPLIDAGTPDERRDCLLNMCFCTRIGASDMSAMVPAGIVPPGRTRISAFFYRDNAANAAQFGQENPESFTDARAFFTGVKPAMIRFDGEKMFLMIGIGAGSRNMLNTPGYFTGGLRFPVQIDSATPSDVDVSSRSGLTVWAAPSYGQSGGSKSSGGASAPPSDTSKNEGPAS